MVSVRLKPYLSGGTAIDAVKRRIANELKKGNMVELDFQGVKTLTTIQIIDLFTGLVESVGINSVDSYLICKGTTDSTYETVNHVLDNHRKYETYSEYGTR